MCFLGLVVIARVKHPIPSRTRPLSTVAPMVLRLKTWESRSSPNLTRHLGISLSMTPTMTLAPEGRLFCAYRRDADCCDQAPDRDQPNSGPVGSIWISLAKLKTVSYLLRSWTPQVLDTQRRRDACRSARGSSLTHPCPYPLPPRSAGAARMKTQCSLKTQSAGRGAPIVRPEPQRRWVADGCKRRRCGRCAE